MNIKNKIAQQEKHLDRVLLFKEGVFYKAYNQGAFQLRFLGYKTTIKHIKSLNTSIVSVGFPLSVLDKLKQKHTTVQKQDNVIELSMLNNTHFSTQNYELWLKGFINQSTNKVEKIKALSIIEDIKNYPLAAKTPMEAFVWLSGLQQNIINGTIY